MAITSINRNVVTQLLSASGNVNFESDQVQCDCTSGAITATLYPSPGDGAYHRVVIEKTDSSANAVTVTDSTFTFSLTNQYDSVICELTAAGAWVGTGSFDSGGSGNVVGPASATADVPVLFSGTTGKIIKNSTPTGTGNPVLQTTPTLTTPVIGVATGTSLAASGLITSSSPTAGIGYATGAGGAVAQGTNRTTTVVLNTIAGAITLISAAGSATPASFTVTNSAVAATDTVIVSQKSGTDLYEIFVTAVAAGSFRITSFTTGGTTVETPVFNFAVIKSVAA
jgi:hypothetical protein